MKVKELGLYGLMGYLVMLFLIVVLFNDMTTKIENLQEQIDNQQERIEALSISNEIQWDRIPDIELDLDKLIEQLDIEFNKVYEELDNNQMTNEEKQLYFTIAVLDIQIYMMEQEDLTEEQQIYYDILVSLREQYEGEVE